MVDHGNLKSQLEAVRMQMTDPAQAKSLAQAIFDNNVFEPIYARMLVVGTRSGSLETVLASLSDTFFDDSIVRLDGSSDRRRAHAGRVPHRGRGGYAHRGHAPAHRHHGIDRLVPCTTS